MQDYITETPILDQDNFGEDDYISELNSRIIAAKMSSNRQNIVFDWVN